MFVSHAGRGEDEGRAGRRKKEINLVFNRQLLYQAYAGVEIALVIVDEHLNGQLLAVFGYVYTTFGVHFISPLLVNGSKRIGLEEVERSEKWRSRTD